jgi:hypothetical protein
VAGFLAPEELAADLDERVVRIEHHYFFGRSGDVSATPVTSRDVRRGLLM